jgi:hypothetical protein
LAWNNTEHILQAERAAGPVMVLIFGIDTTMSAARTVMGSQSEPSPV